MNRALVAVCLVTWLMFCNDPACAGGKGGSNAGGGKPVHVHAYYRKDGTYVREHERNAPRTEARVDARATYRADTPVNGTSMQGESEKTPKTQETAPPTANVPPPNSAGRQKLPPDDPEKQAAALLELTKELEKEGRTVIQQGKNEPGSRLLDKAKLRYSELINRYPNTKAAVEARARLANL